MEAEGYECADACGVDVREAAVVAVHSQISGVRRRLSQGILWSFAPGGSPAAEPKLCPTGLNKRYFLVGSSAIS